MSHPADEDDPFEDLRERTDNPMRRLFSEYGRPNARQLIVGILGSVLARLLDLLPPIMLGVAIASTSELSFNWLGFLTAMGSNISFAGRAITSKPLMSNLSSINVYNWVALIALAFCIPPTIYFEGSQLPGAIKQACSSMGTGTFVRRLLEVGFFYHMYNQVAYQALGKVEPVTHAVANVGKRIFVIGFSILAFGNPITAQTAIGSAVAIFGAFAYSYLKVSQPSRHSFLEY